MASIIIFDSKYGSTADIASRLAGKLEGEVRLVFLRDRGADSVSLEDCDLVVLGAPVYAGSWSKRAAAFAAAREEELASRKFAFFAVGLDTAGGTAAAEAALPPRLVSGAVASAKLGGEALVSKMNFLERLVMRAVSKSKADQSATDLAAEAAFAAKLAAAQG